MISRRTVLRGGSAALALTVGAAPTAGAETRHLVPDYRPSQLTGWPMTPGRSLGMTLGGHVAAVDFTYNDAPHRISVLPATYADVPGDPTLGFRDILADTFGEYYAFCYQGGIHGQFLIQSYGVFADEATETIPETRFGGGLYVVYRPDVRRGVPPARDTLGWIQVAAVFDSIGRPPEVDRFGRANPFYAFGGLTSINGDQLVNFHDISQAGVVGLPAETQFLAETFLAQDTGRRTASGKTIIAIYSGIRWGWQVGAV
jgi:hypothetical protein